MYALGEVLGKTVAEIGDMSYDEFLGWMAYFRKKDSDVGRRT